MNEELNQAIKAYLKENLSISVHTGESMDFYSNDTYVVRVSLLLDGEVIDEQSDSFTVS